MRHSNVSAKKTQGQKLSVISICEVTCKAVVLKP